MREESAITGQRQKPGASGVPDEIYRRRFPEGYHREKLVLWRALAPYLDRLIPLGPVLEVACDPGYFIANVARARARLTRGPGPHTGSPWRRSP